MGNRNEYTDPRADDPVAWRVVGAFVFGLIGAGIGVAIAPNFGGDAYSAIVSSLNAMVGAFLGSLFGGGTGWLIDRAVGRSQRQELQQERTRELIRQQRIREGQDRQ